MTSPSIHRIAAFADGPAGGNPAGVMIADILPSEIEMQRIAAEIGYSETAFAAPQGDGWRVRYFAPTCEVAFCGHATIALGSQLARQFGEGRYTLYLNTEQISVEGRATRDGAQAALISPRSHSRAAEPDTIIRALKLFGLDESELDPALSPAIAHAGNDHLVLALASRASLARMHYDLAEGAAFMKAATLTTINLVFAEKPRRFHSRNAFAIGGVSEDPATGAAAAALGGYLRDVGWPHGGAIEIIQGEDMGARSVLHVKIPPEAGSGLKVSGTCRDL